MDRLTIFRQDTSLIEAIQELKDELDSKLSRILRELQLTRKGHEEWTWGEEILDADLEVVDLEDVEL